MDNATQTQTPVPVEYSPSNPALYEVLLLLFGGLGVHRIYIGKISGLLFFFTAGGFFGIWPLIDLIIFAAGNTKDKDGRPLKITVGERVSAVVIYIGCLVVSIMMLFALGVLGVAAGKAVHDIDKTIQRSNAEFQRLDAELKEQQKQADEELRKAEEELKRIEGEAHGQ